MLSSILFLALLMSGIWFFTKSLRTIIRNIRLGRNVEINDRKSERWWQMMRVALGQSKMVSRPVAGFFHVIIYAGFIIINIEVLEIIIDGIFGTHRIFAAPLGPVYDFLIASFEVLAFLVIIACVVFYARRAIIKLKRFTSPELKGLPNRDAMIILGTEVVLMSLFLFMNASDQLLQQRDFSHYVDAGAFPVSVYLTPLLASFSDSALVMLERSCWWLHIIGILLFLNYVPYSKHFHIFLSFPNVWYSRLDSKGGFTNNEAVANEVRLMLVSKCLVFAAR